MKKLSFDDFVTTTRAADILHLTRQRLNERLNQDRSPVGRRVAFPNSRPCPCGRVMLIYKGDLEKELKYRKERAKLLKAKKRTLKKKGCKTKRKAKHA